MGTLKEYDAKMDAKHRLTIRAQNTSTIMSRSMLMDASSWSPVFS
jgi:hypothetical protein